MPHSNSAGKLLVLLMTLALAEAALAQLTAPPTMLKRVGIDQKLDAQVPLDLLFHDEAGNEVKLGKYFSDKPVVLVLVYYGCPSLCTTILNSTTAAFKTLSLDVGKDFEVVTVSFDPRETPKLAAQKKKAYIESYGRAGAANGWHFLTGDQPSITALTENVGYRYVWDDHRQQYAHGSAIIVLTPRGRVSRYLYGVEYAPTDLRLALVEASQNKIGSLADQVLLLCYQYDPLTGKYGFAITTTLRIAAVLTVGAVLSFIVIMTRRERRRTAKALLELSAFISGRGLG